MRTSEATQLMVYIDAESSEPLYKQVYRQIAAAIISGVLAEDDRLPSIKKLSSSLGISHTTVELSYLQLSVEGYVRSVPRSGYRVSKLDTGFLKSALAPAELGVRDAERLRSGDAFYAENSRGRAARYDFSFANLPSGCFPLKTWRKLENEVFYTGDDSGMTRYTYNDEPSAFRDELCSYLGRARGVSCLPGQIVPQAGTDCALATLFQLLVRRNPVIGIEEPGYPTAREVAERFGLRTVALPTDRGEHAFLEAIERLDPDVVFATPSHQFPTGRVLQLGARTRLLKWAQRKGAYIIEDDSCCEYRYDIRPVPSLQSLDAKGRVVYLGNFSKALSPSLRVAYLVLPPDLLASYYRLFNNTPPTVPWLTEEILARFMGRGYWERHLHKVSTLFKHKHDELLRCLRESMGGRIAISGENAGMHLYVTVRNGMGHDELIETARLADVAVYSTRRFWFSRAAPENNVLIGFCSIALDDIEPGVKALARAWL